MLLRRRTLLATSAAASLASPALAQNYPRRSVQLIVAFPAGSGSDTNARRLGQIFQTKTGQSVVIDNRAGAGGVMGTNIAARAPAYLPVVLTLRRTTSTLQWCRGPRACNPRVVVPPVGR